MGQNMNTIPLIGYCDRLSVQAGQTVNFKVSSTADTPFSASLVRVISADPNPDGPGMIETPVKADFSGEYPSRVQPFYPGSYAITDSTLEIQHVNALTLCANIWPTRPGTGAQNILACGSIQLGIDADGCPCASVGDTHIRIPQPLSVRQWYQLKLCCDPVSNQLQLHCKPLNLVSMQADTETTVADRTLPEKLALCLSGHQITIAAALDDSLQVQQHFDGKIEQPGLYNSTDVSEEHIIAQWDFSVGTQTLLIHDSGPYSMTGQIVNLPARAMTGSNWDGSEMCWRHAPSQYGAIHFHSDDIIDFNWATDFSFTIPDDLPSGIYAAKIECAEYRDSIVFFVCPAPGKSSARLAVLISTFTYSVYGNHARPDFVPAWKERFAAWNAYPWNPAEFPHYGLSTYNFHADGSGICHASHRRPLFNLKPGYLTFGYGPGSGLRHLQADTHLIAWLHHNNIDYDIVTDDLLHDHGVLCLQDYKALTTGSHPEYHTNETLNALQSYRDQGGNLMYLGGNGFYWRVALHSQQQGAIEIRRAEGGIRAWAAEPGEYYQAFDGEYGGLWRRNGRPPQQLVGVGFSAQGQFEGTYYRRSSKSYDAEYSWIFDNVSDEIIGDFGLSGGGAAGFELDRADIRLGTPDNVTVLASSEESCETFVLVPEEQLTHITTWSGEPINELLRADMVYFKVPGGGQVFATGSITFCGSLPHNNFDNNISTIIANVVARFTSLET